MLLCPRSLDPSGCLKPAVVWWRWDAVLLEGGVGLGAVWVKWRQNARNAPVTQGFCDSTTLNSYDSKPGLPWRSYCITCFITSSDSVQFSSVQSLSCVRLFATPWIAARQASLSITNSRSSPKLMSIELVMPSSHRETLSQTQCLQVERGAGLQGCSS